MIPRMVKLAKNWFKIEQQKKTILTLSLSENENFYKKM
jgi:hypothetical protein